MKRSVGAQDGYLCFAGGVAFLVVAVVGAVLSWASVALVVWVANAGLRRGGVSV